MNERPPGDAERRFRHVYRDHYPALLGYALRRSADVGEAHDAVADTFLVLWRRFADAPVDDDQVLPWLYGVARRVLANRHRSRQRQERVAERVAQVIRELPLTEDIAARRFDAQRLLRALLELSESEREVLLLGAWERLSLAELAVVLGCSENAAAIRLHRARRRLTEVYKKENGDSGHTHSKRLRLRQPPNRRHNDE